MRDLVLHRARAVLFRTSHRPSVVATCIAALEVLEEDSSLVERLWENTYFFKRGLQQLGFKTGNSETPITPVIVGEGALAMQFSNRLFEEGVFAQGIVYPTVPADKCRVRTIVTALHTKEELSKALESSSLVCSAVTIVRTRHLSAGTVGYTIPCANTPSSKRRLLNCIARAPSPTITGVIGVSLFPVLNPSCCRPRLKK